MSLIKGDLESMRLMSRNLERQGDTVDGLLRELRNQLQRRAGRRPTPRGARPGNWAKRLLSP